MVDLNSLLGQFAPGGGGQSSPMSMPLLGSPAYQQQQGQRRQAASQLEIQQALDLARALQQQASPENERITSPWQVVGKMAQALGGQLQMRQAAQLEQQRRAALGNAYESAFPSESDLGGAGHGAPGQSADLSYGSGIVPMDVAKAAIAGNESGGNYGEVGPATHGGNALGKYQVMSYDLPQRLADAGLPPMTAAEFLRNPQAQERQFEHEFGGLMQKHGNFNDAASVWFSGRPMAAAGNASDGYMTVPQYVGKANATIARLTGAQGAPGASQGGGQASAFSPGGPGGNAPNGAMAIADALAGGKQPAGGPQIAAGAPSGAGAPGGQGVLAQPQTSPYGPVYVDPRYLPRRPVINRQAFQTIMALGGPEDQTRVLQMLQAQQQPIEVQRPWGKIVVDPQNPLRQQFVSNEDKANTKIGDMEIPTRTTYDYTGRPNVQYLMPTGQYGSLQDLAGVGRDIAAKKAAAVKGAELEAGLKPDVVQQQAQAEAQKQEAATYAGKTAETYVQRQSNIEKTAQAAQDELPQLELLKNAIRDPNFRSGWQSGNISEMSSALRQLGLGQGQIATLLQFAQKAGAAGSLENIQEMAQSGAVRVPEMNMIKQSNFDPHNTPEANFAVVDTRRRLAERRLEVANFANQYMNTGSIAGGTGKGPGHLDHNFDQQVRDYYAEPEHKLFSDKEIENYNQLFDRSGGAGGAPQQQSRIEPPAAAIADLKANPSPTMQSHFDKVFGTGAAAKVLSSQQPLQVPLSR